MSELLELRHDNVVKYTEFLADDTSLYFVMEHCPGRTLVEHTLTERVWRESAVQPLISQLLAGLQYIHNHRIVHRDVKLTNIMVDEGSASSRSQLRLLDFGLGCCVPHALGIVGTLGYM